MINLVKKNKFLIFSIISLIMILLVIMSILFLRKKLDEVTLNDQSFYQYFYGEKLEYDGTLTLNKEDEIIEMSFKDVTVELDSTPIYYQKDDKVLFPKKMSVVFPKSNGLQYKVNNFTSIFIDGDDIYLKDTPINRSIQNCFLYDGRDLFFFIETTEVTIGNEKYVLSPLSYVILKYNQEIEIYQKDLDKYTILELDDKEILASANGYVINMSIDALKYGESSRLLVKRIDILNNLE